MVPPYTIRAGRLTRRLADSLATLLPLFVLGMIGVGIFHPVMGTKARGNRSGYSNAKLDQLLEKAGAEINRGKRAELYKEAQAIVHKDAPLIFLWLPQDLYGASANLAGWKPSPRGIIKLHDAYLK